MSDGEFEEELLETAVRRKPVLATLAAESCHRRELQEKLGLSKTTCHRIIRSFDNRGLLRRTDDGYELTEIGRTVHEQVERFDSHLRAAYRLEPLLEAFESADVSFTVEPFADAEITRARPEDPTPPVERFLELFRDAETVRSLDRTSFIPPLYLEEMLEIIRENDATAVAVLPQSVVEQRFSAQPEIHRRSIGEDVPIRYRINDEISFGLTLYDDSHVGLRAYDDDTGSVELFADTDDPDAVEWATDVFEYYHERSKRPAAVDSLPEWVPESDVNL